MGVWGRSPLGVIGGGAPWGFKGAEPPYYSRPAYLGGGGCLYKFNFNKLTPLSEYLLALNFIKGGYMFYG